MNKWNNLKKSISRKKTKMYEEKEKESWRSVPDYTNYQINNKLQIKILKQEWH